MNNSPKYLRILYAEDNKDHREMITCLLAFTDIQVIAAETIIEALQLSQTEDFDLYLLDSQFPEGSGLDLCRSLHEYAPQIPILIYSACAVEKDRQEGLQAGADAYLTKPYLGDLAETIRQSIEQKKKRLKCLDFSFRGLDRSSCSNYSVVCPIRQTVLYF